MMLELLPLSENNYKDVAAIDRESLGEESWSEALYKNEIGVPEKNYLVAYADGVVVGFGGFAQVFDEGHIMNVAVSSDYRRRGIASKILDELIRFGKEKGVNAFTLEVRKSNAGAIALYEKKGFTLAGVRKRYYGGKEDACIYWLYL